MARSKPVSRWAIWRKEPWRGLVSSPAHPDFRHDMRFERGDIQLLNNHSVLHGRTEFEDWPDAGRKRRLLRQWLNLREGRPLAPAFAERLNTGPRGGVAVKGIDY